MKRTSKWDWISLVVAIAVVVSIYWIPFSYANKQRQNNAIQFELPVDFETPISVTNTSKGVVVGYLNKNGKLRAVQYSGFEYQDRFIFKFLKKK